MIAVLGVPKLLCLQNIANPIAMSVFVRQEKITVRMGLQSDPIDPTKTRLRYSKILNGITKVILSSHCAYCLHQDSIMLCDRIHTQQLRLS